MNAEGEKNMVADIQALVGKVVDYAEHYDSEFLSSMERVSQLVGRPRNFGSIASVGQAWLQDSVLALASALWYGCARQGIPERYWRLAVQAIRETITQVALHNRGTQSQGVARQFEHLCQHPTDCFETDDQWQNPDSHASKGPMVRDLTHLHFEHKNLIYDIRNQLANDAKQTHFAVRANICGMGDKTTSFLLRDVAWVYQLEGQGSLIHTTQAIYIQPVDIWVRRLSEYLWPDLKGK